MNKTTLCVLCMLVLCLCLVPVGASLGPSVLEETPEMKEILDGCLSYCDRLESISLHYVCVEEIKETIYHPFKILEDTRRRLQARDRDLSRLDRNDYVYENERYDDFDRETETNKYTYDYQLIRKDRIDETRTLLKENGKKRKESGAQLKTKRFRYSNITVSPLAILGRDSQKYFDFKFVKEAKLWGTRVYIIEASSKPDQDERHLWGRLWLDRSNYAVLKIEWDERTMREYEYVQKQAVAFQARPELEFGTEHRFEKNGIRFPSKHFIKELYIRQPEYSAGQEKLLKSELEVRFKDYKFFIVETEVKYTAPPAR